ncbi:MAG: glucose-6-phosphate isomerase [Nitrosopumilus sp.]|nr:glucose-6-phosphate isomerase [Nitrosopumilus sp.]
MEQWEIEKFDLHGIHKIYDRWPEIAKESYESKLEPVNFDNINHVVFSGMGGSGAIGDLFSSILSKTDIHVTVVKGYLLPKTVDSNTLIVATSVSGNTIETLTTLKSAVNLRCKEIAFSSGGKIKSFCLKNKIHYRNIPKYHSPRASFVSYVYSILRVLNSVIPIEKQDILESLVKLDETSKQISSKNLSETNPSLNLAKWISAIPVIYYPWGLQAGAIRFKNSLQENAKTHAMIEDVIEACHNGIVAWEKTSSVQPILLEGENDYVKTKERWNILKEYFKINGIDNKEIFSIKGNILSKLINLIYLLDYATIYLAIKLETNPSSTESIEFVKHKL